jgi:SAM-dependent methyltransferase
MPDHEWWAAIFRDPVSMVRALGVELGMTALDLCCGDGHFTAALADVTNGRVYALDFDAALIEQAKERVASQGLSALGWLEGDARAVASMLPEPVDYILIGNTFHGIPDKAGFLNCLRPVLKPGGAIGLINWHARPREETTALGEPRGPATELRIGPAETTAFMKVAGLEPGQIVELPPYHYGVVGRWPSDRSGSSAFHPKRTSWDTMQRSRLGPGGPPQPLHLAPQRA